MGSIKNKLTQPEDAWEEFTLTDEEATFVKTIISTRDIVTQSYNELVGKFLGVSLVPRVGKEGPMQFDLNFEDSSNKVRIKPIRTDQPS